MTDVFLAVAVSTLPFEDLEDLGVAGSDGKEELYVGSIGHVVSLIRLPSKRIIH